MTVFVNLFGSAWLQEASSRVSDRIYICNRKKNREDKIGLYPPEEKIVAHLPV